MADMMRRACPKMGGDWSHFLAVMLQPGNNIKHHKHVQHTVLYFPEDCEPVEVTPVAGSMLYLPPGTDHGVKRISKPRLSIAMLIEDKK